MSFRASERVGKADSCRIEILEPRWKSTSLGTETKPDAQKENHVMGITKYVSSRRSG